MAAFSKYLFVSLCHADGIGNQRRNSVGIQHGGIHRKHCAACIAPFFVGEEIIVVCPCLILLFDGFLCQGGIGDGLYLDFEELRRFGENGCFQVGLSQMWEKECIETCSKIILEVNPNLPRISGGLDIHISRVTAFHEAAYPLPNIQEKAPTKVEETISDYIADLVSDGDCLELGTGTLSNAIAERLKDHRELGLHTEWFNTGAGDLIEAGIITGEHKNIDHGLAVASAAWGEERLYQILGSHPKVAIRPASYVCDPRTISQMNNMIAINTLIEMDLTGQVCSESIGTRQVSGSSGNLCFSLGAIHSKGGKSILCFPSMTRKGVSKIKTQLSPGANVTIPRNYVDYVVTEYGIAHLRGRSVKERALQLISIAHPDVRDQLRHYAKEQFMIV